MKNFKIITLLMALTIFFTGCSNDISVVTSVSSNNTSKVIITSSSVSTSSVTATSSSNSSKDNQIVYKTLNIPMIDDEKFEEWLKYDSNLEEAKKIFPKNCISKIKTGYIIRFHCVDKVAVIYFDEEGIQSKFGAAVYNKTTLKSTDFNSGLIDKNLNYIIHKLDPDGYYPFLYVSVNVSEPESTHFTADGYIVTIKYITTESAWIVSEIIKEKF